MLDTIADSKKEKANMMVNQGLGVGVGGQPGALLNDPMSALQSLTRTPNPNIPGAQAPPMQSESPHHTTTTRYQSPYKIMPVILFIETRFLSVFNMMNIGYVQVR